MRNWQVLILFLTVRLSSAFLVKTWYVPDEYWQSLEVAHELVYGYGELTWEWKEGIRSYFYPLLISFLYKIVQILGLDSVNVLIFLPRIAQAVLSSYADYRFYQWSGHKKWSAFIVTSSYFWYYTSSRTLINTLETALTMIALSYFPWPNGKKVNINKFIWVLGVLCVVRPTAVIPWLPLCTYHLLTTDESPFKLILRRYIPIGFTILLNCVMIDTYLHGSWILTPYNFLKANVLQGIGEFYGSNPWHWYLSNGIPVILGINFMPFVLASFNILKNRFIDRNELMLLGSIVFTTAIYSCLPHKEYRFILPLLPMAMYIVANFLARWSYKANIISVWIVTTILLIGNIVPAYYLGFTHQQGTIKVMSVLHEIASKDPNGTSFLFLTPCHSTPMYSHLHVKVPVRYLSCVPNLANVKDYKDEADLFYDLPARWLKSNYPPTGSLPSHIIMFDTLRAFVTDILSRYKLIKEIFHADLLHDARLGRHIQVYELVKINRTVVMT